MTRVGVVPRGCVGVARRDREEHIDWHSIMGIPNGSGFAITGCRVQVGNLAGRLALGAGASEDFARCSMRQ